MYENTHLNGNNQRCCTVDGKGDMCRFDMKEASEVSDRGLFCVICADIKYIYFSINLIDVRRGLMYNPCREAFDALRL